MKKVLLTGAALMAFAAAGFAQTNTVTVNQVGNAQTATPTQTGSYQVSNIQQTQGSGVNYGNFAATLQTATGAANTANVNQKDGSKSNRAYVTQSGGTGNTGTISQNLNSGTGSAAITAGTSAAAVKAAGGNWAGILQKGSNNTNTYINQNNTSSKNFGEIAQYGNANGQTSIDQSNTSSGNTATINEGANGAGVTGSVAKISEQGNSTNNTAAITQTTSRQHAEIVQNDFSSLNKATINQLSGGTGSTAYIEQRRGSENNQTTIRQAGSGSHVADVYQNGNLSNANSYNNVVSVDQTGFSNEAVVHQDGDVSGSSYKNDVKITQAGTNNLATVDQNSDSHDNKAVVDQKGRDGFAKIIQELGAGANTATILQDGRTNTAQVNQYNVTNSKATIKQDLATTAGSGNKAEIQQGSSFLAASDKNEATILQEYSKNVARLRQYGNNNTATFSQVKGDGNLIKGTASGVAGDYALQQGNLNSMIVTQNSGGGAPYVPNTASLSQIGNSNSIVVSQTGNN